MASQMAESLRNVVKAAHSALEHSAARKTLAIFLGIIILRRVNRSLSEWTMNNWQSAGPWNADRELVLLTGGSSGIGKQIMEDLAKREIKVVVLDVQGPKFELPSNVFFYEADVTSPDSIKTAASQIRREHGDPTVLINNAGVGHDGTILEESEDNIQASFQVNTVSHFWMVREFLPSMIRNNHGHVITMASMASFVTLGEMVDYSCSKASALAFHEGLAQELRLWYKAPKVRTSIVHPNWVQTPMIQQLVDAGSEFRQPIMSPQIVSAAVVKQILSQRSGQIILPLNLTFYSLVRAFPSFLQESIRKVGSGMLKHLRDREGELVAAKQAAK